MTDDKSIADPIRDYAADDSRRANPAPDLPHTAFTGTGYWLWMNKPKEFDRILDESLARVSREPRE